MVELQINLNNFRYHFDSDVTSEKNVTQPLNQEAKIKYKLHKENCKLCNKEVIKQDIRTIYFCGFDCQHKYFKGQNHPNYGKKFEYARHTILKVIEKQRQMFMVKNIFSPPTNTSYWILGMLASDGWLFKNKNHCGIGFSGDTDDVSKIKTLFNSPHKLQSYPRNKAILSMGIPNLYNSAYELGLTPNKSLTLTYPKIPKNYETTRHFVRGVFDGDGCVYLVKDRRRNKNYIQSNICSGSKHFLIELQQVLDIFNIHGTLCTFKQKYKEKTKIWYILSFSSTNSKKLYIFFYENTDITIYSQRRKERFEYCLKHHCTPIT